MFASHQTGRDDPAVEDRLGLSIVHRPHIRDLSPRQDLIKMFEGEEDSLGQLASGAALQGSSGQEDGVLKGAKGFFIVVEREDGAIPDVSDVEDRDGHH